MSLATAYRGTAPRAGHAPRLFFRIALLASGVGLLASARAHPVVAAFERFHADKDGAAAVDGGLLLLNELNCVACHAAPAGWSERLPGRDRISLGGVGTRLSSSSLLAFVAEPGRVKPGTAMPQITAAAKGDDQALVAYLSSLAPVRAMPKIPAGNAERGKRLFASVGCTACHAPEEKPTAYPSVPLGLAAHYDRAALADFIQNPLATRPAGRMPAFELADTEAADLGAYLNPAASPVLGASTPSLGGDLALGRAQFGLRGCAACHDTGEKIVAKAAKALVDVRVEAGCLSPSPAAGVPQFDLSAAQVRALTAAVRAIRATPAPAAQSAEERVTAKFEQLNCYACHEWRGRGGPDAVRAKSFIASDSAAESLGELGRLPPKLDMAGRKLTSAWLGKLLWGSEGGVRPYLTVRMPRFGERAAGGLVPLLAEACRPAQPQEIDTSGTKGHQRFATGRQLIGTGEGGLGCVACHGLGDRNPTGVRAINLSHSAQRLRPEYFKALLLDPQATQPGTIMPPLLKGRKSAANEIESVWTYLREFEQNPRLPEGLVSGEAYELKPEVEGKPIVFRTFLEGVGAQAIAVGFPARLHIAFDALEARWALVWRGRFLDATSNWDDRMMPPVKPLGEAARGLAPRVPLAQLRDARQPWPANLGDLNGVVFRGYRIGPGGVPVFRYRVGTLEVEDVVRPDPSGRALLRTVTVRGAGEGWYFYGLGSDAAPQPVVWHEGVAMFEETLSP